MSVSRSWSLLALGLTGCWLDGDEWALKRLEAAQGIPETVVPSGPDLGLGSCVQDILDGPVSGINESLPREMDPPSSCSPGSGREAVFAWDVRYAGCYVVSAKGTDYAPVVYTRDACDGATLACSPDEALVSYFDEGPVLVVVDAMSAGGEGEYEVETLPLIQQDLGTTTDASGDTTGLPTWEDTPCGAARVGASAYLTFTPPTAGTWRFEVEAQHDVVLSLHQACDFSNSLDCADATLAGEELVTAELGALEEVILRIGGAWPAGRGAPEQGPWELTIREL